MATGVSGQTTHLVQDPVAVVCNTEPGNATIQGKILYGSYRVFYILYMFRVKRSDISPNIVTIVLKHQDFPWATAV